MRDDAVPVDAAPGRSTLRRLLSFPDPVDEMSARLVAGGVAVMALVTVAADLPWLTIVIAYGFVARVLTGPSLSPLGQLVTRVLAPRMPGPPTVVPGPPKRFAQGIGAVMSTAAAVLALGCGLRGAAFVLLGLLAAAATLEAVFAYCIGCRFFVLLVRVGLVPPDVCESCNDIWASRGSAGHATRTAARTAGAGIGDGPIG